MSEVHHDWNGVDVPEDAIVGLTYGGTEPSLELSPWTSHDETSREFETGLGGFDGWMYLL